MPPITAVIAFLEVFLPQAISLGTEIAPLIQSLKTVWSDFASANGATQDDFDRFHVMIKSYEDDLAALAAKAQDEIQGGAV